MIHDVRMPRYAIAEVAAATTLVAQTAELSLLQVGLLLRLCKDTSVKASVRQSEKTRQLIIDTWLEAGRASGLALM